MTSNRIFFTSVSIFNAMSQNGSQVLKTCPHLPPLTGGCEWQQFSHSSFPLFSQDWVEGMN